MLNYDIYCNWFNHSDCKHNSGLAIIRTENIKYGIFLSIKCLSYYYVLWAKWWICFVINARIRYYEGNPLMGTSLTNLFLEKCFFRNTYLPNNHFFHFFLICHNTQLGVYSVKRDWVSVSKWDEENDNCLEDPSSTYLLSNNKKCSSLQQIK